MGFGHCIGMCGPIVVSLSLNLKGRNLIAPHLLYSAGRVVTYTLLGGVMGATGSFTLVAAHIAGIQKGALILAGLMIIIMGLAMSGWFHLGRFSIDTHNPQGLISRGFKKLSQARSGAAYLPIGLLLGLLPCGPVYTALIAAAGAGMKTGSIMEGITKGMLVMLFFGIGRNCNFFDCNFQKCFKLFSVKPDAFAACANVYSDRASFHPFFFEIMLLAFWAFHR